MARILMTALSVAAEAGGPSVSVVRTAQELAARGNFVRIYSFGHPFKEKFSQIDNVELVRAAGGMFSLAEAAQLLSMTSDFDVVHAHGAWLLPMAFLASSAKKKGRPYVASPRGMLEPWAMNHHGFRKKAAWRLYEGKRFVAADVLHATSKEEMRNLRALNLRQPIAVIENGVDAAIEDADRVGTHNGKRRLLFLSRIHPKKGLERLFAVWNRIYRRFPDWELVVAGSGDAKYIDNLKKEAISKGFDRSLVWAGFVGGAEKKELYQNADLFVLPTYSENFGNVVAEALVNGVPVLTTAGTPWSEIESRKCGWFADNEEADIERKLIDAMSLNVSELAAKGKSGRIWMMEKYSWSGVASKMNEVYSWLLGGGRRPDFVFDS